MENAQLHPHSVWSATVDMPVFPPLSANLTTEVCVIGAGLAGLTTAYLLAREGVSVVVVEALDIGAGETSHTTAHIAVPDERYSRLEASHGLHVSRLVAQSFAAALDQIESIVRSERIDCEFERVDGYLFSCADNPETALQRELEAAKRAGVRVSWDSGIPSARTLPHAALEGKTGGMQAQGEHSMRPLPGTAGEEQGGGTQAESMTAAWPGPCLRFPHQAQFHPLRYLRGLARSVERRGGRIFAGTRALDVQGREGAVVVITGTGKITADDVVVATNTPFNDRVAIHVKQNAYQTYVIAALVKEGLLPRALMWDDADPYHYVRLTASEEPGFELLIVGGADHKVGQEQHPQRHYDELESWMRERFPQAGTLMYRWSGEVMEPLDGLAYLGRNPGSDNVYVITGDSGNGMTYATIGGMLVCDLVMGRQNPWLAVYDPARKPIKEALEFVREQSNIAARYKDWITGGDDVSAGSLGPGEGALIRMGMKKYAVYRDDDGALHCRAAACSHLGCIVQWNGVEKTWDCPCHGSRFSAYGSVLHGPAVGGLAAVHEEEWEQLVGAKWPRERPGERRAPR